MRSLKWTVISLVSFLLQELTTAQISLNKSLESISSVLENELKDLTFGNSPIREVVETDNRRDGTNGGVVLYWGQGDFAEQRLSYYCDQEGVSIVVLGFIVDFVGGPKKSPILNLSDNCRNVNSCTETAKDIKYCQNKGLKVLLSVGGAAGPYHKQNWDPDLLAWWLWNKFLGGTDKTLPRPFGNVILDGIDYDPESVDGVGFDRHIDTLRQLFKTQYPPRDYLITAAPQCPDLDYYPKNAVYNILHPSPKYDAYPDMVFVQFYNNYCSATTHETKQFNFNVWDKWATERTRGRTKIYLGVLGKENNMDTGYVTYEKLTVILDDIRRSRNFGGVMIWDAGYAYANELPFLKGLTFGQAAAKYLQHLSNGNIKMAEAFDAISLELKEHKVPILIPISSNSTELDAFSPIPCDGLSFLLLRSVTGRSLIESIGISPETVDKHLESVGMDGDDLFNPGSRICLIAGKESNSMVLSYIYNASIIMEDSYNPPFPFP